MGIRFAVSLHAGAVVNHSEHLPRAAKQVALESDIALFANERSTEYCPDSAMMTREHDHRVRENAAQKTSVIEVRKPVGGVFKIAAKDFAPLSFV